MAATRQETEPKRSYKPGPTKTRATTTNWDEMPEWTLVGVRDVRLLTGLSNTALNERVAEGRFPAPSKHSKDRVWSLGQVRRWCEAVVGGQI